ncbi:ABC transporter permease [Bacillus pumilus]|uniref:ABC transporter permease n=1 Tax=Bacillus pumilus TaxID=1408 RepID=UPI00017A6782|nr:ABC transporter permease [Bacillus pumilus]EDW21296.1 ABC-2 type transporter [Bacillus pumilus ATCC 7061]MCR4355454.1 ABC transporter permease [Bacillus pumilus]MCY7505468.1 ABC transporter permease [Bacillus pumilus]MDR4268113.1 ABC transporter permease [Bacillus pumilus]MED4630999.1 ABC transporter permease [Bacillus pumilus]
MKSLAFAARNRKEILRDPLNLAFGIGFPLVILFLLHVIQANVPTDIFAIDQLIPGIAVFGLSFISLFSGMLIAKDRSTSFLMRLFTTPLSASDYIVGYIVPLIPIAIVQVIIGFIAALFLELPLSANVLLSILVLLPTSLLFIGIGLLVGSIFNDKQVGGICGALLTNISAWLSGTWFDLNLVGGWFKDIAYALPFAHAVDASRAAISGDYASISLHLWWVIGYMVVIVAISIFAFKKKMNGENA